MHLVDCPLIFQVGERLIATETRHISLVGKTGCFHILLFAVSSLLTDELNIISQTFQQQVNESEEVTP